MNEAGNELHQRQHSQHDDSPANPGVEMAQPGNQAAGRCRRRRGVFLSNRLRRWGFCGLILSQRDCAGKEREYEQDKQH